MTRILSRAFWAVALVGVTFALAACAAQTPERETGAVQIGQPVTTVGGLGGAKAVIPVPDLTTPAQETTTSAERRHPADEHGYNAGRRRCLDPHSRAYLTAR